jgi:histidine triad (HIT) family protein
LLPLRARIVERLGRMIALDESCTFCRVVRDDIPSERVLETDYVVAFRDINPQAPVHVLVAPRRHVSGMTVLPGDDLLWNHLLSAVQQVVKQERLARGFRIVVNDGPDGGQTVPHLHIHVLGGRSMHWPPG